MKKLRIIPILLSIFYFSPSDAVDSLQILPPPPLTSTVYNYERKGGQDFLSKIFPKKQRKKVNQAFILDQISENKTLFSIENLDERKIVSEGWYTPLQSTFYLPWGTWTPDFKFEESILKGSGEIGNVSKPDMKITVKCKTLGKKTSQTDLGCVRYIEAQGGSLLTAGMGSVEKILATYSPERKAVTKIEVTSQNEMGLFGKGSSRVLLTLNEKESEARTLKLREALKLLDAHQLKTSLAAAENQSPTFESLLKPQKEKQLKTAEDFKKSFAKEGATLEQLRDAKNDDEFMKVGHALLFTADPEMIHQMVPVLIEKLKTGSAKPNDGGFTDLLILQWLPALTFQYLGSDPQAWEKWWQNNKNKSFDDWAAISAESNPTLLLRIEALKRLQKAKRKQDIPLLKKLLKDEREEISVLAAAALADHKEKSALPVLVETLDSPNPQYRVLAFEALANFSDQTLGYDPALPFLERYKSVRLWKAWLEGQKI